MTDSWRARLLDASQAELQRGYNAAHHCLFCAATSANEAAARAHLASAHGDALSALLALDKSFTGLTDTQKELIALWRDGTSDTDIANARGVSTSTLRNQRFALRERERSARVLLATLSLAGLSTQGQRSTSIKSIDESDRYFQDGKLVTLPARTAKRIAVLRRLASVLALNRRYTERDLKEIYAPIWPDHAYIRRELVDARLLQRTPSGSAYWLAAQPGQYTTIDEEGNDMPIDKKAAKLAYKSTITPMGIYCLTDTHTGRSVIAAEKNLNSVFSRFRFMMGGSGPQPAGPFSDPQLYADYKDHPDAFELAILEQVDTAKCASYEEAVDKLEQLCKGMASRYADRPQYLYK